MSNKQITNPEKPPRNRIPKAPYKADAYEKFIAMLRAGIPVTSWQGCAEALGVTNDTISVWKQTPEAQEAIQATIKQAIENMKVAGVDDWRMWDRYLKLTGVNAAERVEHTGKDGKDLIPILGGATNDLPENNSN